MALPTASDNPFPSLLLVETAAASIGTPAAGRRRLFVDTDNTLKWKDEAGLVSPIGAVNKWDATTAPAVTDDSGDGYAVGSRWIDVTADKEYVCLDASVGAAVWTETTQAGGGGGSSDWDAILTQAADATVTNSATPVSSANLTFAADASSGYEVDGTIFYSGNDTTGDFRWRFAIPSVLGLRANGYHNSLNASGSPQVAAVVAHTSNSASTQWPNADVAAFTDAADTIYAFHFRFTITTDGSGTIVFQFANVTAAGGRTSTLRAGSTLRYRKLFP